LLHVGTLKEVVDRYVEVMHLVGIEPIVLDIESASLGRTLLPASYSEKQQNKPTSSMIIDIGARTTNVSIFDSSRTLNLSVTIPIAGNHFTKAIAEELKKKDDEAEKLKRTFSLDDKETDNKILSILQAHLQKIIKEIQNAIKYYEDKVGNKIEQVILVGGSALLPKLDEHFMAKLERKVIIGNPLEKILDTEVLDRKNSVLFANVIGLALRGVGDISVGINLLGQNRTSLAKKK
jgi:type IV pilus assembly protein PilM